MAFGINTRAQRARMAEAANERLTTPGAYDGYASTDPFGGLKRQNRVDSDLGLFSGDIGDLTDPAFRRLEGQVRGGAYGNSFTRPNLTQEQREQFNERFRDERVRGQRGTRDVRVYDALVNEGGLGIFQGANLLDEAIKRLEDMQQGEGQSNRPRRRGAAPSRASLFNVLGSSQV